MSGGNTRETLPPESESRSSRLPPPKNSTVEFGRTHGPERLILVRDPPRERLARARSSAEPEETLLARVEGKQYPYRHTKTSTSTTATRTTNCAIPFPNTTSSNPVTEEEFYADLYQYYYDVTKPTSNEIPSTTFGRAKPKSRPKSRFESNSKNNATARKGDHESEDTEREGGSDTERDEEPVNQPVMSKKRGSLQAIFAPSFLTPSTPTEMAASPPTSPTATTKYGQRLRALSAVAQPASPSHHATFSDASSGEIAGPSTGGAEGGGALAGAHQRKRSMTFSIMTSFSSSNSNFVAPAVPSPTTPTAATHANVHSPRSSPPPAFLLDDDPFANLTSSPSESMATRALHLASSVIDASLPVQTQLALPVHSIPRSPLNETVPLLLPSVGSIVTGAAALPPPSTTFSSALPLPSIQTMIPAPLPPLPSTLSIIPPPNNAHLAPIIISPTSTPDLTSVVKPKPKSAPSSPPASASASTTVFPGPHALIHSHSQPYPQPPPSPRALPSRAQPRPAHQRPAFSARPSLPSLDTLARMNVVLTKKVRKGRVGAGLPFEPWDLPSDDESLPTPPPPPSATSSSPSSSRLLGYHQTANSNINSNAELKANADLNDNVNASANHDVYHTASSPLSSPTTLMPIPSTSMLSSPIPIPSSALSSSHADFDSDSGSSSNSTTPTSSLISANLYQRPQPPSHTRTLIASPQPLLPSQILALGSVAADVEIIVPVGRGSVSAFDSDIARSRPNGQSCSPFREYPVRQESLSPRVVSLVSNWLPNTSPVPATSPTVLPVHNSLTGPLDTVPELEPSPPSLNVELVAEAGVEVEVGYQEEEQDDEYFGDLLDRYQMPSRATSEDGHGHEQANDAEVMLASNGEVESEVEGVVEELETLEEVDAGTGVALESKPIIESPKISSETIEGSFSEEYSYLYAHGSTEGDVDAEAEQRPGLSRSGSIFSSPSSAFLARSFSARSYSSIGSADSGHAVEQAGLGDMTGRVDRWSYGRFADPSQSLSSLELDLDGGGGEGEGHDMMFDVDADPTAITRERGDSTRSSSSHPSLSRTRSSSDDSDALQSPAQDYDYSFFPYSHARSFARFYQSGYSTLFTPPAASEEDGPSFQPEPDRLNLSSSSSSVDDLGEREASVWGKAFREESMGMTMPGGLAVDGNGEGGFGFGFDKVLIAAEECQHNGVEEKESLANTTSIAAVRTTSTVTKEADRHSFSSSEHRLPAFASSSSASVSRESGSLDPESVTQTIHQPGPFPDDDMFTRLHMPSTNSQARTRTTTMHPRAPSTTAEPIDSSGYQRRGYSSTSSNSQSYSAESSRGQTAYYKPTGSQYHPKGGRGRGNSDEEDGEEDERRRRRALERMYADDGVKKKTPSTSSSEDDGADNHGEGGKSASKTRLAPWSTTTTGSRTASMAGSFAIASSRSPSSKPMDFPASSNHSSRYVSEDEREEDDDEDDDDDVPLAQRIPGALTAQKTMRRQFREEREQRKRDKAERLQSGDADRRARQETLRPAGAGAVLQDSVGVVPGSSSHDAVMLATSAVHGQRRPRTLTLPGKSPISPTSAFNPHDLARKLQNVQMAEVSPPTYQQQYPHQYQHLQQHQDLQTALSPTHLRAKSLSRTSADGQQQHSLSYPAVPSLPATSPANQPRSSKDPSSPYHQLSPISPRHGPPNATLRPMRSFHRPPDRRPNDQHAYNPADAVQRLERASTSATRNPPRRSPSQSRTSADRPERTTEPVPPLPATLNVRSSNDESRKLAKAPALPEPRTTRTSGDVDHPARVGIAQQPMPGLINVNKIVVSQQRIFVANLQQFHMVEIGPTTTAGDVVTMLEAEGALNGWAGSGGWMVFEIAQDFGMERPVRSYEFLADVQASWLKDKSVNFFVLKLTPLAAPLSRNAIPSSSPTHSAYIEWEAKRGKWSKRWLQLREHNLYLSKRDNGKDEVLICSLSNFDAYHITRAHRAPKPYVFAIKSTDNLSFFENTADYLHTFSCSEKDGKIWMEKILVARSYVLHQERHILFSPRSTSNNASAAVSRSGTKKHAPARPTHQPLVALPPLAAALTSPHRDVFEPGSLLAKHI